MAERGSTEWWIELSNLADDQAPSRYSDDYETVRELKIEQIESWGWDAQEIAEFGLAWESSIDPRVALFGGGAILCMGIELGIRAERARQIEEAVNG